MAKLTIPEGYVVVEAKQRGAKSRDYAALLKPLRADGDQMWLTQESGKDYKSEAAALATIKKLQEAAAAVKPQPFGVKVCMVIENALEHTARIGLERIPLEQPATA